MLLSMYVFPSLAGHTCRRFTCISTHLHVAAQVVAMHEYMLYTIACPHAITCGIAYHMM